MAVSIFKPSGSTRHQLFGPPLALDAITHQGRPRVALLRRASASQGGKIALVSYLIIVPLVVI
jgi:hypothetical protein